MDLCQCEEKKTPTEARISDGGGKDYRVGKAGHNSHPITMICIRRDKLMQAKKIAPTDPASYSQWGQQVESR